MSTQESSVSELTSQYASLLKAHGVRSPEAAQFREQHAGNGALLKQLDLLDEVLGCLAIGRLSLTLVSADAPTVPVNEVLLHGLLARYVDLMNAHGRESPEVMRFCAGHADNVELMRLIAKTHEVRDLLLAGQLMLRPDD